MAPVSTRYQVAYLVVGDECQGLAKACHDRLKETKIEGQPSFTTRPKPFCNTLDHDECRGLKNQILAQEFQGLLVVVVPDSKVSEFHGLIGRYAEEVRSEVLMLEYGDESYPPRDPQPHEAAAWKTAISIAELHCLQGGVSLIVLEQGASRALGDGRGGECDRRVGPPFRFHVVDGIDEVTVTVGPAMAGSKFDFKSTELRRRSEFDQSSSPGHPYKLDSSIHEIWYSQEFSDDEARDQAWRFASKVWTDDAEPDEEQRVHRVVLAGLRLARRLSTRTFEGAPYECSILIGDAPKLQAKRDYINVFSAPEDERAVFLNFNFWDEICDYAEMAQSLDLRLLVDYRTGQLVSIVHWSGTGETPVKGARHLRFSDEATNGKLLIHVRGRFIEVYAHPDERAGGKSSRGETVMRLWFDGFRWRLRPFRYLKDKIQAHCKPDDDDAGLILEGAISIMLDRSESSIIVLAYQKNEDEFKGLLDTGELSTMRRATKGIAESGIAIADLTPSALAGILHLDGAHFIDESMKVQHVALQVQVKTEDGVQHPGSGTATAQFLQNELEKSCVVKVSASGELKFFRPKKSI